MQKIFFTSALLFVLFPFLLPRHQMPVPLPSALVAWRNFRFPLNHCILNTSSRPALSLMSVIRMTHGLGNFLIFFGMDGLI
jgi:hypothetical protein